MVLWPLTGEVSCGVSPGHPANIQFRCEPSFRKLHLPPPGGVRPVDGTSDLFTSSTPVCPCMSSDTEQSALPLSLGAAQPSHPILPQSHWSHSMRRVSLMGLSASTLRSISHGFDAISVSLLLMRPLLGYDVLTPWYVRIAAPLVAFTAPFFSKRARRIMVRPSMGKGLFPARFGSFGLYRICSASTCGPRLQEGCPPCGALDEPFVGRLSMHVIAH